MEPEFWHQRWREGRIGFHNEKPHPLLVSEIGKLGLAAGNRVFIPLCGKTVDIDWFLASGYRVVGCDLSDVAVQEVFARLGVTPKVTHHGTSIRYQADGLVLYSGDFFDLTANDLGSVQAVYDRAALVALPGEMRARYVKHLVEITGTAPQLLICFDYDQSKMSGPPFSVSQDDVAQHYCDDYDITLAHRVPNTGNLGDRAGGREEVWLLTPRNSVLK